MRRPIHLVAALMFSAAVFSATAGATVLIPIEFRELVSTAPIIVHGRVVTVQPQWVDGRRSVETLVTIQAEEYLKGDLGSEVTFKVPGGQIGRYNTVMIGAPTFRPGDEVVLFLNTHGASIPFVVGLTQGVFRVVPDPRSGQRLVFPPVLMGSGADAVPVIRGDAGRRPMEVGKFTAAVRQLLIAQGGVR